MATLAELLGAGTSDRVLVISCDELGFTCSANVGVYQCLREGIATSGALLVPAPWARGAARDYRGEDIGVNLTLNAEHDLYRWGPITQAPSLLDGDGGFPRTIEDAWEHADLDEVRREWRAQVERAIYWGFDVSHLSAHLPGVELRPEFFDIYLDLAEDFALPIRLPSSKNERRVGFPLRRIAGDRGILAPDRVAELPPGDVSTDALDTIFAGLEPGVTALHLRPALDSLELRSSALDWSTRATSLRALTDSSLREQLATGDVLLRGYRDIRDAMRRI